MAVRSTPTSAQPQARFSVYKLIAAALWLVGAWTTYLLIARMVGGQPWIASAIESLMVQSFLTVLESPVWRGRAGPVNVVAVAIDTLANAGGIFPFAENVGATPPAQMFIQAFHLDPNISPFVAIAFALLVGYLIAAGPEAIWRWE